MPGAEKILIVDDERLVRWSLRQKCEEWGYQVVEAAAGDPGLRLAQHESPDLVLLDVRMPDISGIQVLEQIKKAPDAPPVIMITADPQLDDVKSALKLGAYDFVGKPLDFEELRVTIQNALEATPPGGAVAIQARPTVRQAELPVSAQGVQVRIQNSGSGIPAELREQIFEPFFSSKHGGTGLGLTIARRLIESHSGRVAVESDGSSWTSFIVEIPA